MSKAKDEPDFSIEDLLRMAETDCCTARKFWKESQLAITMAAVKRALRLLTVARTKLHVYEKPQ